MSLEASGEQGVAQLLESARHVLGDAASVVAAIVLPAVEPLGLDFQMMASRAGSLPHVTVPSSIERPRPVAVIS
jgi:hypothetical protein